MELTIVSESMEIIWRKTIIYINQIEMDPLRECIIIEEHEFALFIIDKFIWMGEQYTFTYILISRNLQNLI